MIRFARFAAILLLLTVLSAPSGVFAERPSPHDPHDPVHWKSDRNWTHDFAVPGLDGDVSVVETIGGDLYVSGRFSQADGVECPWLARFDGRTWHAFPWLASHPYTWLASPSATTMYADDSSMLIAGNFTDPSNNRPASVVRWSGGDVIAVGGDEMRARVARLFRWNGALIAAGDLRFGDRSSDRFLLARFSNGRWTPLGPPADTYFAQVSDAIEYRGRIVVSGKFIPRPMEGSRGLLMLRPDGAAFDTLLADSTAQSDRIEKLAVHDGRLIVTGSIHFSPNPRGRDFRILASWDGAKWTPLDDGFFGVIWAMRSSPEGLVIGGRIHTGSPNDPEPTFAVARLGAEGIQGMAGLEGTQVRTLALWDGRVVAGGGRALQFVETFDQSLVLGVFDGTRWRLPGVAAAHVSGFDNPEGIPGSASTNAFLEAGGSWFAGGNFDFSWRGDRWLQVGPVARWTGDDWVPFGNANWVDGEVNALAWFRGYLYAAGQFYLKTPSGFPAVTLIRSDGHQWEPVEGAPGWQSDLFTLAVFGDRLIVGGRFVKVGNVFVEGLAGFDGQRWSTVGEAGLTQQPWFLIRKLLIQDGALLVAGRFESIAGVPAKSIARWDGNAWTALNGGYEGDIYEMTSYRNGIAVAGECDGSSLCANIMSWDGTTWKTIPDAPARVRAMAAHDDVLFVGGFFDGAADIQAPDHSLRAWDGRDWHALGSGFPPGRGQVMALALRNEVLWVGGAFTRVGGQTAMGVATWTGLSRPGDHHRSLRDDISVSRNPSRFGSSIGFVIHGEGAIEISIYDPAGRRVHTQTAQGSANGISTTWDGRDADGKAVPAGIYFARAMREGQVVATKRLVRLP